MAETEVIREFFVSLGFRTDETGLARFKASLEKVTKTVFEFGRSMTAAAIEIEEGIARVAAQWTDLYYMSQRVGDSAGNLHSWITAAQEIGLTAAQSRGAVEQLAAAMRANPALEGWIRSYGVDTSKGITSTISQLAHRMLEKYGVDTSSRGRWYLAQQTYQRMGLDPDTMLQIENNLGEFDADIAKSKKRLTDAGISPVFDKTAAEFQRSLIELGADFSALATRIAQDFMPQAQAIIHWLDQAVKWFTSVNNLTHGWIGEIAAVVVALGTWRVALSLLRGVFGGLGSDASAALARVAAAQAAAAAATGAGAGAVEAGAAAAGGAGAVEAGAAAAGGAGAASVGAGGILGAVSSVALPVGAAIWAMTTGPGIQSNQDEQKYLRDYNRRAYAKQAAEYLKNLGWSPQQISGIIANLDAESGLDPHAIEKGGGPGRGIAQWGTARQKEFKRQYHHDVEKASLFEQLQFLDWELRHGDYQKAGRDLSGATDPSIAAYLLSQEFEKPAAGLGAAAKRAAMGADWYSQLFLGPGKGGTTTNIVLNQKTDIHVSDDGTGRNVARAQKDTNSDLARDLKARAQ